MNRSFPSHMEGPVVRPIYRSIAILLGVPLVLSLGPVAFAEIPQILSEETVAEQANVMWESGAIIPALEILDQGIEDHPEALATNITRRYSRNIQRPTRSSGGL